MNIEEPLYLLKTKMLRRFFLLILLLSVMLQIGCAGSSQVARQKETSDNRTALEERWGVKILPVHLTTNDFMVDFRFRVIDPEKARPLTAKDAKPNLIDEASGQKLSVPNTEKLGSLRAKGNPIADRTYFVIFSNSRGLIKKGSKVTVVIGDFKAENMVVE